MVYFNVEKKYPAGDYIWAKNVFFYLLPEVRRHSATSWKFINYVNTDTLMAKAAEAAPDFSEKTRSLLLFSCCKHIKNKNDQTESMTRSHVAVIKSIIIEIFIVYDGNNGRLHSVALRRCSFIFWHCNPVGENSLLLRKTDSQS